MKKLWLSAFVLLAGCSTEATTPLTKDCTQAKNDSFEAASALPATEDTYPGLDLCENDTDWYEIEVAAGQWVFFEIDFDGNASDLAVDVFDVNGDRLNKSDTDLDYERVAILGSGTEHTTYIVKVY